MQIVIDIDEEDYAVILSNADIINKRKNHTLEKAVLNGKSLPKGHGRLIDEKDFYENLLKDERKTFSKHDIWMMLRPYSGIPTIIREDKED